MARAENDSWDIATGVGLTAVTVAVSRATETTAEHPLIDDPFAEILISGAELRSVKAQLSAQRTNAASSEADARALVDYHAGRTRFFDDHLRDADAAGVLQHVILASGLDSRAFRLDWSPGARVFEVDQPLVLDYKARTLRLHGVEPKTWWMPVGADLRTPWERDLEAAGFDGRLPTTWLAEGLLPFLSGDDQERLFAVIQSLSASGSRMALEAFNVAGGSLLETIEREVGTGASTAAPLNDLFYGDEGRSNPVQWWRDHGWVVGETAATDYLARLGRPQGASGSFAALSTFVTGVKG